MSTTALEACLAALLAGQQLPPAPSDPLVLTSVLNGRLTGKLDASSTALLALLTQALDTLPALPSDPGQYPASGGLFRDGDANGYRLVRILPAS